MKTFMTLILAVMACHSLSAQTSVEAFPQVIAQLLRDFPNNLRNVTGELVLAQGEFENYACTLELPGAERSIITRYHSKLDTTVSWQATMPVCETFEKAARQYRELYGKLQQCSLMLADGTPVFLRGSWEPAHDNAAFTTSTLTLKTGDWRYREVKVEVELVYTLADWNVHINIYNKKPDDLAGTE